MSGRCQASGKACRARRASRQVHSRRGAAAKMGYNKNATLARVMFRRGKRQGQQRGPVGAQPAWTPPAAFCEQRWQRWSPPSLLRDAPQVGESLLFYPLLAAGHVRLHLRLKHQRAAGREGRWVCWGRVAGAWGARPCLLADVDRRMQKASVAVDSCRQASAHLRSGMLSIQLYRSPMS